MMKISKAEKEDVKGIISVQNHCLLKNRKTTEAIRFGFLVYPINVKDLEKLINEKRCIILVAKEQDEVVGYILSYDCNLWKKLKPKWEALLKIPKFVREILKGNKVLYLRHIARMKDKKCVGTKLLLRLIEIAKKKNYEYIICEILNSPIKNKTSTKFFKNFDFKKIGCIIYPDNFKWGVYFRKL